MAALDSRAATAVEVLDKIAGSAALFRASPASKDGNGTSSPGHYEPWSREALLRRMQSFKAVTWFAKPPALSAAACALQGWRNSGTDQLTCEYCAGKLVCRLPFAPQLDASKSAVAQYVALLSDAHADTCPWRQRGCDAGLLSQPPAAPHKLQAAFSSHVQELLQLDCLPAVGQLALVQLAAAAAAAGALGTLAEALCMERDALQAAADQAAAATAAAHGHGHHATSSGEGAVGSAAAAAANSSAAAAGQAAAAVQVSSGQKARLLALCGWQLHQLRAKPGSPPGRNAGGFGGGLQGAAATAAAAECALGCSECGASVGLWQHTQSGPLYEKARQSRAFEVAQRPLPVSPVAAAGQEEAAARAPGSAAAGGGVPGAAAASSPPSSRVRRASSADVQQALVLTIAGGELAPGAASGPFGASASGVPAFGSAQPFGSGSGAAAEPVFGLGAFAIEAERTLSGSGPLSPGSGGSGWLGQGDERPAKQRRLGEPAEASGPAFDPLAAHRQWCPWAHAADPAGTADKAAPGAEGDGALSSGAALAIGSGWLHCLRAVAGYAGDANAAGGGADYGARVRQVIGTLRGVSG